MLDQLPPHGTTPASRPAAPSGGAAAEQAVDDLDLRLQQAKEQSLNYQILRRTFKINSNDALPPSPTPPQTDSPPPESVATVTNTAPLTTDVDAVLLSIEQRSLEIDIGDREPEVVDPLILNLDGGPITTSGLEHGVSFDLSADGRLQQISVPTGENYLLALDRNTNGRIDDGRELFGDQHGAAHGFAELARLDDNGDGRIDQQDQVFEQLQLLRFRIDGSQQLGSLRDAGIHSVSLDYRNHEIALNRYDRISQLGKMTMNDGSERIAADVLLAARNYA
ncbi:hypothetical protein [Halopseudomonas salegens]|uniref:Uncharacterized protein n=1 Tax=Halopseudomonas salegens TaxID=1434072 RepID=A0A1H2EEY7_9GAMM|nr:hypothetical protein [Halopseudomonas salegens]SDT93705.1 hypothetical protein SAMN05216210_0658 [Halopseudomonas salegens]